MVKILLLIYLKIKDGVASFVRQEDGDGDFILGEDGADFDRVELEVVRSATLQQPEKNACIFSDFQNKL